MKIFAFGFCLVTGVALSTRGSEPHSWIVPSPDHEQTFSYGMEKDRVWTERGRDRHLALQISFTNDPLVDRINPRQYDNFTFSFPLVSLAKDGHTYSYRSKDGHLVPVATRFKDLLGVSEVRLLPNAQVIVDQPHGYLSLRLIVSDETAISSK